MTPANVELLVELPVNFPGVSQWEAALQASSVAATPELRDRVAAAAALLKSTAALPAVPEVNEEHVEPAPQAQWLPTCPVPERLWTVYRGGAEATMVSSARDAAQKDLKAVSPPAGLTQPLFTAYVSGILRQMPLMIEIDTLASTGLTDSQAHDFLISRSGDVEGFSAEQSWRVLKAWLIHFFPTTYRLETGQEVFSGKSRMNADWAFGVESESLAPISTGTPDDSFSLMIIDTPLQLSLLVASIEESRDEHRNPSEALIRELLIFCCSIDSWSRSVFRIADWLVAYLSRCHGVVNLTSERVLEFMTNADDGVHDELNLERKL